jgi:hypothetical protein
MASGTIDTYSVSLVQNKANWIDELLKSKTNVFVNKDDESSINPAELLLALSEEFGDKNKTEELKERLKHEEETKLAAGREKKRIRLIQTLERYRVPLYRFRGDKNSFDYLQRTEKVKNIEKTLLAIPSFANKEIIGDNKPFLYSEKYDKIISMGDYVFYNRSKHAVVTGFDFKSKSVLLKPLKGNDAWESRLEYLELDGGLFAHNPGKEFLSVIPLASSGSFYREIKDDGIKEKYYPYHLQSYACLHPVPLFHITDGNLYAGYTNTIYEPGKYLNPFSGEDLEKMKTAKTLTFLDIPRSIGVKEAYKKALAGIKEYTPAAFSVVSGLLPIAPPVYREIIPDYHNTPGEFEDNLKFLSCHPYYKGDPVRAAKAILDNTDEKDRKEIKKALRKMGCTDGARTLKVISALSPPGKNNEKITDIKDFFRGHVRVSGLEI